MKQAAFWGILILSSLVASFLISEVLLRLLGYAGAPEVFLANVREVDDPVLNWRYMPNSVMQDGDISFTYNSVGFRDTDHTLAKQGGVTRIVVLGDSVTEGNRVKHEALFVSHLQTMLGEAYEVINLGMSGLNIVQEIRVLELEGIQYKPDVVVANFVLNDCDDATTLQAAKQGLPQLNARIGLLGIPINPQFKHALKSSALIYFLKGRAEHLLALASGKERKNYYVALWDQPHCRDKINSGFNALQSLQKQHGFSVHIVIWPLLIEYQRYELSVAHRLVKELAEQKGFEVFDLLPVYSSLSYRDLQVAAGDNVHPNAKGHRLSAQAYVDWFLSQKRLTATESLRDH